MGHDSGNNRVMQNFFNAVLMVAVIVPPAYLTYILRKTCPDLSADLLDTGSSSYDLGLKWLHAMFINPSQELQPLLSTPSAMCEVYMTHPFLCVNLVYFLVVDIGFYFIYLAQGSTWLIDPHWQLIPQSIAAFWFTHPSSNSASPRAIISMLLLNIWAVRLLHNYFRREQWNFGLGEDWRYADMRKEQGTLWIVTQFFAVSVAQHGMLVGLTMPLQATMAADGAPLNYLDAIAGVFCVTGIVIGFFADNQLWAYMNTPNKPMILETGLWRYSRHPNHFGEQVT